MSELENRDKILRRLPLDPPRLLLQVLIAVAAAGAVYFIWGATGQSRIRAWQIYLVNFLFWSGIAQAGVIFSAVLQVTGARWGRPLKRIAEGMASFLPISFVLFLIIFLGSETIFPWVREPIEAKQAWLNLPFAFARGAIGLLILYGLSFLYIYYSLRPDIGMAREMALGWTRGFPSKLISGWRGLEVERERSQKAMSVLAPVVLIAYAVIFSLMAFDLIMSLDPEWYSTLFGAYFFVGNFYLGLATLAIASVIASKYLPFEGYFSKSLYHDLGKLIFAFCMLTGDFFWSQFLVIWYGNLPEEVGFVFLRVKEMPWAALSYMVLGLSYFGPFLVLLSREVKRNANRLAAVSAVILFGMWVERYLLVVPSMWPERTIALGPMEVLITLGFFSLMVLSFLLFSKTFPLIAASDPYLGPRSPSDH